MRTGCKSWWLAVGVLLLWGAVAGADGIRFVDVTEAAGIDFVHANGAKGERLFPESVGAGVVLFDYDRDGWLDIYFVNSGNFQGQGAPNVLYHNNGDGTFTDVTKAAGVGDAGYGVGAVAGDVDGDGWEDLYVCNFRGNVLYHNNGDGTFTDITKAAGVGEPRWSTSATFFDMENDGDLDLFVANYVDYTPSRDGCEVDGTPVYCDPEIFDGVPDTLYRNNGDGTFTDVSEESGIVVAGLGLAVISGDIDDDGDADVIVANDMTPNLLYENRGDGTFEEKGFFSGIALGDDAMMGNSMGVDLADFDNDGGLDLVVTNFQDQVNTLYRNERDGFFTDVSYASGTGAPSLPLLAWGCAIADFDNDGWRDLFIVNGQIHDNIELINDIGTYAQPKQYFHNNGDGTFSDFSAQSGEALTTPEVSRGAAFGDLDNDGDLDVVVNNLNSRATLLRNDGGHENAWLRVVLEPSAAAVGARVWVDTLDGSLRLVDEVHSGGSYASHNDTRLLFGLGKADAVRVTVRWRDGTKTDSVETPTRRELRFTAP